MNQLNRRFQFFSIPLFVLIATVCTWLSPNFATAADRVRVVETPNHGEVPDAEVDGNGNIHLAYVLKDNAYYVMSKDGGKTFTEPLIINSDHDTVHPPNMFRGPDLAVGKDGRVHVIWYVNAYQRKLPQDQWGVHYSYLDRGGTAFAKSRNLNHKPSDNYSLAASEDGRVAVVWMAGQLFVTSSSDNGATFGAAGKVANADPCECCASRAYFSKDGTLAIAYRDKANNERDMHLLSQGKGQKEFANQKVSTLPWQINACPMSGTFLSGTKDGLLMAWETKTRILYGRPEAKSQPAPTKELSVPGRGRWPIALTAPDGTVLMAWKNEVTLFWQLLDASDKPLGSVSGIPGRNTHRHAAVVTADGNFVVLH